jgi:hypothetical protein
MTDRGRDNLAPLTALVLGWAIPGAGHAFMGRWGKGLLFFVLIVGLLLAGFALGVGTNVQVHDLSKAIVWWFAAQVGCGGPALALVPLSDYFATRGPIDWAGPHREIGTLYTAIAGFLNVLVMMDAYIKLAYPHRGEEKDEQQALGTRH